jgi:hypothetical protein
VGINFAARPDDDSPTRDNSAAHPTVALVTIAAMVLFVQSAEGHMVSTHLLRGSVMDAFVAVKIGSNEEGLRQAATSGFVAIWANEVVQSGDRLREIDELLDKGCLSIELTIGQKREQRAQHQPLISGTTWSFRTETRLLGSRLLTKIATERSIKSRSTGDHIYSRLHMT